MVTGNNSPRGCFTLTLALEQYERFSTARLAREAKEEALVDDEELKKLQDEIEKKQRFDAILRSPSAAEGGVSRRAEAISCTGCRVMCRLPSDREAIVSRQATCGETHIKGII